MSAVRARVIVSGRVQGVFFRETCRREAAAAGVDGWVRNRADGTVEAVFQGPREAVEKMLVWCETGPPSAAVTGVETLWETAEPGVSGFTVRGMR